MSTKIQKQPKNNGFSKFFKLEYILVFILIIIALVMFFNNKSLFSTSSSSDVSSSNYESILEKRVESLLKNISNLGDCDVLITVEDDGEKEVLKNVTTKTENGVKTTTESVVMVQGKPYIIKEYSPKIKGVIVVCSGADILDVKIAITEVLTTTLSVSSENIRILKMK